jgi:carboxyl-terminal processing protease
MSSAPTPPNPDRPEPSADAIERPYADERIQADELDHSRPSRDRRRIAPSRFSLILVAIMAGSALFMGGFSLGAHIATTPGTPADQETRFGPFWDVYSLIQSDFAGSPRPSQDQLVQAAIKGMMESLNDPWSYYQGPSDFANSLLNVGGQAEGIGAQIQVQPVDPNSTQSCTTIGNGCELAVVEPIPGSPAEAAGIKPGDVIATVGGKSLDGLTIDQAIALIKGPQDTTVVIGLIRGTTTIEKSIVRKIYDQPEVDTRTLANGAVAYIHIDGINDPASSQFKQALATALAAGRHNVVLDLRGNLGGYVEDAVKIASEFIGSGTIAYQVDSTGKKSAVTATAGGQATDPSVHVVVLVDGNTASAAEILAGALQARGRAQLVGSKTYGKGVVQEWLPLPNNFGGIHLTIADWLTPNNVWIQGKGLIPDITNSNYPNQDWSNPRAGTDPVLDAGLQQLGFPAESGASASPGASSGPTAGPAASSSPSAVPTAGPTLVPTASPT